MNTPAAERLRLTEIFLSVQGEARAVGWPTVFVRLTGCPLRCQYCDTAYAFHGGEWWDIDAILAEVARHGVRHVCVTGGEPLSQKRCLALLERLCEAGYDVSLETSGAIDIAGVDPRVSRVVDLKTPASQEMSRNRLENLPLLTAHDQVKFVVCDRADYEWARAMVAEHALVERCEVLFSPSFDQVAPRELAEWILADRLPVRFQMQLHKQLWGDAQGR
ncbi:MAG: 7-carboxy-7-deazaguanine synthase QueE [Arenimonas sp.]|nr:7-carboxy-7-deazaguanine synthase QueE [Arenimonas sp.]